MQQKPQRSRRRILAIGALVGSVLSMGMATSDVSARANNDGAKTEVNVDGTSFDWPVSTQSLRSGIRW